MSSIHALLLAAAVAAAAGCAAKRERYDVPAVPVPAKFKQTESAQAAIEPQRAENVAARQMPEPLTDAQLGQWWRMLASAELNALVDRAVANNGDLRIATLRIVQAKARADQAVADELPTLSIPYQAKAEAPKEGIGTVEPGGTIESRRTYQLSLRGDWRADIWGERRSMSESAEMQLWRSTYLRDDTRRQLIASVVSLYLEYLSLNDRIHVARETETVLRGMLDSVRGRMEVGDATATDMEQQRTAVYAVQATIPGLELQRENVTNSLAQLLGVTPGSLALSDRGLDSLAFPAVLPGIPASLLLRRPDVRAVEARLLAADADIDAARARLLPPLDLTAQVGYGSRVFSRLFQPHTYFWTIIANLSATIFDYGKRNNEIVFARALHEELVETYVRVLYGAIRETDDAIATIQMNGRRMEAQRSATEAARRAWNFSMESYGAGAIDYLTLLDTERTYHRNLDEFHRIRMERHRGLAALFSALGGGVPQGGPLPGTGARPQAAENPETAASAAPADNGRSFTPTQVDDHDTWLVEVMGLQDRAGVAHVWRDLIRRFPDLMAERVVLPRLQGRLVSGETERVAWYRVLVGRFESREQAETFCSRLTAELQRCRVVSSRDEAAGHDPAGEAAQPAKVGSAPERPVAAAGSTPSAEGRQTEDGVSTLGPCTDVVSSEAASGCSRQPS